MSLEIITKRQEFFKEIQEKFNNLFFNNDDTLKKQVFKFINVKLIDNFLNIKEEVDQDIIKNVDYLKNKILLNTLLTDRLQNTKHTKKIKI